ncbi:hypothetical protein KFK09_018918 [Dendrobium nobile]|uniref:TF-B3 domain-containing protein n=1 Tax=Dendrobium nobile TaxID=94219 RepID=A0A8T3AYF1_DENNO|nr:hypothetical protein KFK09_018918 [Dendrobium nobile]
MRLGKWEHLEMNSLQFVIKFKADELSEKMAFPLQLASSRETAKLAELIYLKGPSGNQWEVKLSRKGDRLYFEDGWKEFVKDHHVMEDDYLVFKYCGKSCFTILFFDKNGCESPSSYFVKKGRVSASTKLFQAKQKYMSKSSEVNECSTTKVGDFYGEQFSSDDDTFSGGFYSSGTSHSKREILPEKSKKKMKKNSSQAEARALNLAKSISKRNPCFLEVLTTSSIRTKFILVIPEDFVMDFKLFNPQIIILQNLRKKEWLVEYTRLGLSWILLWKTFVKDNNFREGDVCVFELTVTRPKLVMVVHIFRAC